MPARLSLPSFFFNDTPTTEIYTLSLHDALPISLVKADAIVVLGGPRLERVVEAGHLYLEGRSEEHTSELQSQSNLVCRLLLEKKNVVSENIPARRPCVFWLGLGCVLVLLCAAVF